MLNIDFDLGTKLFIGKFIMKDVFSSSDLENLNEFGDVLDVIKIDGIKYTCLVKGRTPRELMRTINKDFRKISKELIWDTPTIITEDISVISVIGNNGDLKRYLEALKMFGTIKNISYQLATYREHGILSCLTDRQQEVILEAKRKGYYEYPRRINGDQLAKILGIQKAATIEHLRKAEGRIISNLLCGN